MGNDMTLPLTPGSDMAGVVETVGAGTTRFSAGDRIVSSFNSERKSDWKNIIFLPVENYRWQTLRMVTYRIIISTLPGARCQCKGILTAPRFASGFSLICHDFI